MKIFKLSHSETYWDGKVEIDTDHPEVTEAIKNMVEFWMGWEDSLDSNEGDYTQTFLKMLGRKLVLMQLHHGYNLTGIIEEMSTEEGWYPLDGSYGIKLVRCDVPEVSEEDIFLEEVSA